MMRRFVVLAVLLAVLVPGAAAQTQEDALQALNESRAAIDDMEAAGVPTERATDLYDEALIQYRGRLDLERQGQDVSYGPVLDLADRVENVRDTALEVNDEIAALDRRLSELERERDLNLSAAKAELRAARQEFRAERFEEARGHVDQGYREISQAQSTVAQLQAFSEASRRNLIAYVEDSWQRIVAGLAAVLLLGGIAVRATRILLLQRKVRRLKQRRRVLVNLIAETQGDYFQEDEISRDEFEVLVDRYQEKINEIDQTLPGVEDDLDAARSIGPFEV